MVGDMVITSEFKLLLLPSSFADEVDALIRNLKKHEVDASR